MRLPRRIRALPNFAVFVVGLDRPGVLASVTTSLVTRNCNITGATGMVPRSLFSLTFFVVAASDSEALLKGLEEDLAHLKLDVLTVAELFTDDPPPDVRQHVPKRTLHGLAGDRPGILADIARFLAEQDVTVKMMLSMVTEDATPACSTTLRIEVEIDRESEFENRLADERGRLGFEELELRPEP
jgi:predicted amino acid-binding ACT domain protein